MQIAQFQAVAWFGFIGDFTFRRFANIWMHKVCMGVAASSSIRELFLICVLCFGIFDKHENA